MNSPLRLGIVGFGTAGRAFLPALAAHPDFVLAAITEPVEAVRADALRDTGVPVWPDLEAMLAGTPLDVVYVATPTPLHAAQVQSVVAAGRHVLVEKPMASSLAAAQDMVAAVAAAGVVCVVGHSYGFDAPIRAMREQIVSGRLGRVRMVHTWSYTDWMYRPRRPDELDPAQGGGVTYRQGAHQFDIVRVLCGGLVTGVRARTFDWDPNRRGTGAHVAWLDFADGAVATVVYNGYGGFSTMDLGFDIDEMGHVRPAATRNFARRSDPASGPRDAAAELQAKQQRARGRSFGPAPHQPFFGVTLVICERGDLRQVPEGIAIYSAAGTEIVPLAPALTGRLAVLDELHDAIRGTRPALHDARWGLANLEVCEAAIASSNAQREVPLQHQVAAPPGW